MVQTAFCDLFHKFHKKDINVHPQIFAIILWRILMSPLMKLKPKRMYHLYAPLHLGFRVLEWSVSCIDMPSPIG